jgi:hypothetical protein
MTYTVHPFQRSVWFSRGLNRYKGRGLDYACRSVYSDGGEHLLKIK